MISNHNTTFTDDTDSMKHYSEDIVNNGSSDNANLWDNTSPFKSINHLKSSSESHLIHLLQSLASDAALESQPQLHQLTSQQQEKQPHEPNYHSSHQLRENHPSAFLALDQADFDNGSNTMMETPKNLNLHKKDYEINDGKLCLFISLSFSLLIEMCMCTFLSSTESPIFTNIISKLHYLILEFVPIYSITNL